MLPIARRRIAAPKRLVLRPDPKAISMIQTKRGGEHALRIEIPGRGGSRTRRCKGATAAQHEQANMKGSHGKYCSDECAVAWHFTRSTVPRTKRPISAKRP